MLPNINFKSFQYNGRKSPKCYKDVDFQTNKKIDVVFNYIERRFCEYKVKIEVGPIVGIVFACVAGICLLIWLIIFCIKKKKEEDKKLKNDDLHQEFDV